MPASEGTRATLQACVFRHSASLRWRNLRSGSEHGCCNASRKHWDAAGFVADLEQQLSLNGGEQVVIAQGAIAGERTQGCQRGFRPFHLGYNYRAVEFHYRRRAQFEQLIVQIENQIPVRCAAVLGASVGCGNCGLEVIRSHLNSGSA